MAGRASGIQPDTAAIRKKQENPCALLRKLITREQADNKRNYLKLKKKIVDLYNAQ